MEAQLKIPTVKAKPIAIHFQAAVSHETTVLVLVSVVHLEKAAETTEFTEITFKMDESVKIASQTKHLNDINIKRKEQMPNMAELVSTISWKLSDGNSDLIWMCN